MIDIVLLFTTFLLVTSTVLGIGIVSYIIVKSCKMYRSVWIDNAIVPN